jgi:DNA polymerase III epsilon subunit family exonuclease
MGLLDGAALVALDTETTGFSPGAGHALIEVARVNIDGALLGSAWSSLVNPGRPIPPGSTFVHGITDEMVADAPAPAAIAATLRDACQGRTLVFHNAAFDLPFLVALMRASGATPLWNAVADTVGLARGLITSRSYSLGALAEAFGLPAEPRHRALGDALTTARLFLALAARWERERGITSLAELAAVSQDVVRLASRGRVLESALPAGPAPGAAPGPTVAAPPSAAARIPHPGAPMTSITEPVTGQTAPEFRLRGPGGPYVTLSEFRGRNVVLVFFPLAFSPVCSHQLPEIQRALPRFEALDAVVLGVSVDSYYANQAFAQRLGLTFPLLSDLHHQASHAYGVFLPEKSYSARVTFVIDREGRLVHREDTGDPSTIPSLERVLEALARTASSERT